MSRIVAIVVAFGVITLAITPSSAFDSKTFQKKHQAQESS